MSLQKRNQIRVIGQHRQSERSLAPVIARIHEGAAFQEQSHQPSTVAENRQEERGFAIMIGCVNIGARIQKGLYNVALSAGRRYE